MTAAGIQCFNASEAAQMASKLPCVVHEEKSVGARQACRHLAAAEVTCQEGHYEQRSILGAVAEQHGNSALPLHSCLVCLVQQRLASLIPCASSLLPP